MMHRSIEILMIDDSPADIRLTQELFKDCKILNQLTVITRAEEALCLLRQEAAFASANLPDLILLNISLLWQNPDPAKTLLVDASERSIPMVLMTGSADEEQLLDEPPPDCQFVTKPLDLNAIVAIIRGINHLGIGIVQLPQAASAMSRLAPSGSDYASTSQQSD